MDGSASCLMRPSNPVPENATLEVLVLRLEAPLLSFGGMVVDERRITREMPGSAMLTGLLGNALGWLHTDHEALDQLQRRLLYAVRRDRCGERVQDFQTTDLGQDFMRQGWTTRGRPEGRGGGTSSGTHIRQRHYLAGAAYTVALALEAADENPDLDTLQEALRRPARPLFLGRKTCLPSRPLLGHRQEVDRLQTSSPLAALALVPPWTETDSQCRIWWSAGATAQDPSDAQPVSEILPGAHFHRRLAVVDQRDWRHQFHSGKRYLNEGHLDLETLGLKPPSTQESTPQGDLHV